MMFEVEERTGGRKKRLYLLKAGQEKGKRASGIE